VSEPCHLCRPCVNQGDSFSGCGLFTTKELKAGDFLLVEIAFTFAFASDNGSKKRISLVINPEAKRMTMGAQAELLEIIIQKLY
jgi:hypothetical protein